MNEVINSLVSGDRVTVTYDHPTKLGYPQYNGTVETVADKFIRIKTDNGFKSFSKCFILNVVRA